MNGAPHWKNAGRSWRLRLLRKRSPLTGFTGQMYMENLGLHHYKARAYHAGVGRFLQTDPIGYGDGMSMYAYVGNDPVNMVDPTGMIRGRSMRVGERLRGCLRRAYSGDLQSGRGKNSRPCRSFRTPGIAL